MKNLTTNEIRTMWLDFFQSRGHHIEESKSLIPVNDNSLLFINSGVATLKNYFNGTQTPPSNKITNAQKSIRTNDIENVGVTSRHHTLFEMLGNFSIGDYFKDEAIDMAYELLTSSDYFDIDVDKLYFTVHPNDQVAYDKWLSLGINPDKIVKLEENFWEIGNGPGGPNTEIFYDRGESYDARDVIMLLKEDLENDRIIEIWNIVFSEFNCRPGEISQADYEELPQKNIDTGMGLERMACIMQEVETNFETDNFMVVINKLYELTNLSYEENKMAYRVIADHIRALTFAIADGIIPSNDGRGYVIRRILRRAVRFGFNNLNIKQPFMSPLVDEVILIMKDFYPYLEENKDFIKEVIILEEEKFLNTIEDGLKLLNKEIENTNTTTLSGLVAFKLYDTYGFPIELTLEECQDRGISVDIDGFNQELELQRQRARAASNDDEAMSIQNPFLKEITVESKFIGYDKLNVESKIMMLTDLTAEFDVVDSGECFVILDKTPFYAESGGQASDHGRILGNKVIDVQKLPNGQFIHKVVVENKLGKGTLVDAIVCEDTRSLTTKNHSTTHLLHLALHEVLGSHAKQAGSLQDSEKTRFDFSNLRALNESEIIKINNRVNELIKQQHDVIIKEMSIDEAKALGAEALFGEKYGDVVRVVNMGPSIELCGGTHVANTSDIELFQIISESGIGSGIRRIEATTSKTAITYVEDLYSKFDQMYNNALEKLNSGETVNTTELDLLVSKLKIVYNFDETILDKLALIKDKNKEVKQMQKQSSASKSQDIAKDIISQAKDVDGVLYVDVTLDDFDPKLAKDLSDEVLNQLGSGVVCLTVLALDKATVIVKVSDDVTNKFNANLILQDIIKPKGGRGGGKPTMAQGGYPLD